MLTPSLCSRTACTIQLWEVLSKYITELETSGGSMWEIADQMLAEHEHSLRIDEELEEEYMTKLQVINVDSIVTSVSAVLANACSPSYLPVPAQLAAYSFCRVHHPFCHLPTTATANPNHNQPSP